MPNPFYLKCLTRLMESGDPDVIPQLFRWTRGVMTEEDFIACVELLLDRVEEMSIRENEPVRMPNAHGFGCACGPCQVAANQVYA